MEDRVFPSSSMKPQGQSNGAAPAPAAANEGAFPPAKSQAYRPVYRTQPPPMKRRRSSRSCCCSCCLWLIFLLVILVVLVAIAVGVLYAIYRPHRPSFDVTGIRLASFNVARDTLASRIDINVTAHNPNKKLVYIYEPATISVYASQTGADIGDGLFPGFVAGKKNTTLLRASLEAPATALDATAAADLKKSKSLSVDVEMDTKAGVKIGGLKTKKIGIKVRCSGITLAVPKGKSPAAISAAPNGACKVKLRIKIWKWKI